MSRKDSESRIVVGLHSCEEAIKVNPHWVTEVIFMEGKDRDLHDLAQLCQKQKLKTKFKGKKFFNDLDEVLTRPFPPVC